MKIVSACLIGINCRYDCKSKPRDSIIKMVEDGEAIPVCPEQLGGLPTPRPPSEEVDGRFKTIDGVDVTEQYHRGAIEALKIAKKAGCNEAFLKSKSPMCGVNKTYDGTFSSTMVSKDGYFARLLRKEGIKVNEVE